MKAKFSEQSKITKRKVDATREHERDYFVWDTETKGFGLKVTPASSKVYLFQYRQPGRKTPIRITIGKHGDPWTADGARVEAEKMRGDVKKGIDPKAQKKKAIEDAKSAITVSELCDLYLEAAPTLILPKKKRPKKASSLLIDKSNIERHIKPLIGELSIKSVTQDDVEQLQVDIAAGKTAGDFKTGPRGRAIVKGGPGIAARSVKVLGSVYSYAIKKKLLSESPVRGVEVIGLESRNRFLSAEELARLGDALIKAKKEGVNPFAIAAIRLLMLTGARKSEILTLRWDWVDIETKALRLPDSKTGVKSIPLAAPALELLTSLPRIDDSPFVIPGGNGHLVGLTKVWYKIRAIAKLDDVRIHDLRHSFASVAVAGGDSLYLVGKVLGHKQSKTTEIYAHLQDDPLRAVADRAANKIVAAMTPEDSRVREKKVGKVVKMPNRTK